MNKLIMLALVLLLVIGLVGYVSMHKTSLFAGFSSPTPLPTQSANESSVLRTNVIALSIKDNKLIGIPKTLQVQRGEMVVLRITSDTDDELELLGYDKHVFLQKGKMVVLSFLSTITGNFSYFLRGSQTTLGSIAVVGK